MIYCMNCGDRIENEEMICVSCGTNMGRAVRMQGASLGHSSHTGVLGTYLEKIQKIVKGMIISPVSSTLSYSKDMGVKGGIILAAALAFLFGILGTWIYEEFFSRVFSLIDKLSKINAGMMPSNVQMDVNRNLENIKKLKVPYTKSFVVSVTVFILSLCIIALVAYLIGRIIFRQKGKAGELWSSTVCSSIPFIAGTVLSVALSYISYILSFIPFIAGSIISLICLYYGVKEFMQLSENRAAILLPFTFMALVITSAMYIQKLFLSYVNMKLARQFLLSLINYLMNTGGFFF